MLPNQTLAIFSNSVTALIFASLTWLFADALVVRIEIKTLFKAFGSALLTIAFTLALLQSFSPQITPNLSQLTFWLQSIGLWLLFAAFILDPHSKLQFLAILAIVSLILFRNHALLAIQAMLIAATVLAIAKITKHNDLIPFGVGFVLIAVAEFFSYLENTLGIANMALACSILYLFAAVALFLWLWQYLIIRFNLAHKLPKVGI